MTEVLVISKVPVWFCITGGREIFTDFRHSNIRVLYSVSEFGPIVNVRVYKCECIVDQILQFVNNKTNVEFVFTFLKNMRRKFTVS